VSWRKLGDRALSVLVLGAMFGAVCYFLYCNGALTGAQ